MSQTKNDISEQISDLAVFSQKSKKHKRSEKDLSPSKDAKRKKTNVYKSSPFCRSNSNSAEENESEKNVKVNKKTISADLYKTIIDPDTSEDDSNHVEKFATIKKGNFARPVHNTVDSFLKMHPNFELCNENKITKAAVDLKDIGLNEEIWILQCPKTINIEQLLGKKLNINDTSNIKGSNIQCVPEHFPQEKMLTMFCDAVATPAINFQPTGKIIVRESIKTGETNFNNYETDNTNFPFPQNLKIRHPLLGAKYKDKLNLTDDVKRKLQKASISKVKEIKNAFKVKIKEEITTQNSEGAEDNFLPKKRKISINESSDAPTESESLTISKLKKIKPNPEKISKKIKNQKIVNDDVSNDLEWLQRI